MSKRTKVRSPAKKHEAAINVKKKADSHQVDTGQIMLQQMHVISECWQSDIAFFHDELHFFRKLIDKYLMWLIDEDNIESTRRLVSDLSKLEKRRFSILQRLDRHCRHLANLVENPFSHHAQQCVDDHSEIEVLVAELAKDFRQTKKNVFHLTEHAINSEKAKRLLNGV
jgi:hypothetical protein